MLYLETPLFFASVYVAGNRDKGTPFPNVQNLLRACLGEIKNGRMKDSLDGYKILRYGVTILVSIVQKPLVSECSVGSTLVRRIRMHVASSENSGA
jgi:hypothetical protein